MSDQNLNLLIEGELGGKNRIVMSTQLSIQETEYLLPRKKTGDTLETELGVQFFYILSLSFEYLTQAIQF